MTMIRGSREKLKIALITPAKSFYQQYFTHNFNYQTLSHLLDGIKKATVTSKACISHAQLWWFVKELPATSIK